MDISAGKQDSLFGQEGDSRLSSVGIRRGAFSSASQDRPHIPGDQSSGALRTKLPEHPKVQIHQI